MNKMLGNKKYILIFILPALVLFIGFTLIPLITSGIYSFFEYNGIGSKTFIGIKNYIQLFAEDRYFPLAVKNSLILVAIIMYSATNIFNIGFGIIKRCKRRQFF